MAHCFLLWLNGQFPAKYYTFLCLCQFFMIELKNKKILLLGLGLHGGGAATTCWLHKQGARLIVSDLKTASILGPSLAKLKCCRGIKFVLGQHREQDIRWADIVVQNPGVPKESPYIRLAKKLGKPVLNEASLFFDHCQAKIVGITGTRGKSTTTALIGAMLSAGLKSGTQSQGKSGTQCESGARPKVVVAGNIRTTAMLDVVDKLKKGNIAVLELSSWQLEGLEAVKRAPSVAVITNLYPDHLNRYKSLADYYQSKKEIFRFQKKGDILILNADDIVSRAWGKLAKGLVLFFGKKDHKKPGAFVRNGIIYFRKDKKIVPIIKVNDLALAGEHNLENVLAALAAAKALGISDTLIKPVLKKPLQLSGRQEVIGQKNGVTFINDTTATTPVASIMALKRFTKKGQKILLIAGGADKKLDYRDWAKAVEKYCYEVWLLKGNASDKMARSLKGFKNIHLNYTNLPSAVREAFDLSERGDIILLSPGAASFNLWQHEFERGEDFNKAVKKISN